MCMMRDNSSSEATYDSQEQTVQRLEIYIIRTGDGEKVVADDPEYLIPEDRVLDYFRYQTRWDYDKLWSATRQDQVIGSVLVDVDEADETAEYVRPRVNSESVETLKRYNRVSSTVEDFLGGEADEADEEDAFEDDFQSDVDDDAEDSSEDTADTYTYDVHVSGRSSGAGGRTGVNVEFNRSDGTYVSWDIGVPCLAHKTAGELLQHICRERGLNSQNLVRGRREGERVMTVKLSEGGDVVDVTPAR